MNYKYELEIFLNGTFHQDIQSPEIAVKEYMKDNIQSMVWREWNRVMLQSK
ncbi:hypothetical protein [Clostridium oceanicum]|uniref:Uncharacterized protein n=1 Tax=Clostridium oceanicum TaxID=1543 RepID=A0ABN1JKJ7_9CLOT